MEVLIKDIKDFLEECKKEPIEERTRTKQMNNLKVEEIKKL